MFKNLKLFLIVAFWGILSIEGLSAANPKREFRSTWFTTVWNLDWPKSSGSTAQKAELTTYLDQLKAMNLTSVCFQVRSLCDAMYKSSYEPWSSALTGTRGSNPGWDPLAFVVEECHKRGMECYAWFNPFRWSTGTTYNTSYDQQWRNKGWILTYGSYSVLN
ncbi:MAG: family 10 glycosylhydrolase, partial [Muribaculaceae bacterium]|nr:family 10 glycosylhydrolase [Muribaculaceae bacterium]